MYEGWFIFVLLHGILSQPIFHNMPGASLQPRAGWRWPTLVMAHVPVVLERLLKVSGLQPRDCFCFRHFLSGKEGLILVEYLPWFATKLGFVIGYVTILSALSSPFPHGQSQGELACVFHRRPYGAVCTVMVALVALWQGAFQPSKGCMYNH
jgi:hypothetical protein